MKRHPAPIALAFLLALSLASPVASAEGVNNPECLGSACGRPKESSPLVKGDELFKQLWAELLVLFG